MASLRSCLIVVSLILSEHLAAAEGVIVRFSQVSGESSRVRCGVLLEETGEALQFLDLKTFAEESIPKSSVRTIKNPISEQEAATILGPSPIAAWAIRNALPRQSKNGRIAALEGGVSFINLGTRDNLKLGQQFNIMRGSDDIKDPVTGEVLGKRQLRIATVEVVEVQERLAKAKSLAELEVPLEVGDIAIPINAEIRVAVLPLKFESGKVTATGQHVANELTTSLSRLNVPLVERGRLDDILIELALENSSLFDAATVQKIGQQAGAFAVVTGDIQPLKKEDSLSIRLIEVATGKVLYATTVKAKKIDVETNGEKQPKSVGKILKSRNRWTTIFGSPESLKTPPVNGPVQLNFYGPDGQVHKSPGEFALLGGALQPKNSELAILPISTADDFELTGTANADGTGGWFILFGWTGDQGYRIYNVTLRQSVYWAVDEVGSEKFIGNLNQMPNHRWRGSQNFRLKVSNKKLSFVIGDTVMVNELEVPKYEGGEIYIGTSGSQYGPKNLRIESLQIRSLE